MLTKIAIANYRSLRQIILPLQKLNVVTGMNGSGKSSLYRALRLLAETARGGLVASIAREGGLQSTLWAGPESHSRAMKAGTQKVEGTVRQNRINLKLGFASDDYGYAIDLGLPVPGRSMFGGDPEIKRECIWAGQVFRPASMLVDRNGPALRFRSAGSQWQTIPYTLPRFESMMTAFSDPAEAPEMAAVREKVLSWRFYDHFRTDADAPPRQPQIGTHTPVLSGDGADLAAALQTIIEIGDVAALEATIEDAFPGATLEILNYESGFLVSMRQHGLLRSLTAKELSDGTLRYLLLCAALLTPRPPQLLVLNEPETSLHPDLVPALGRLITAAAAKTQVVVVTHNASLISTLAESADIYAIQLEKTLGETGVTGMKLLDIPHWVWPER